METTQRTDRPKLLGISDEVLTCDCCGKSDLKRTLVIEMNDAADPVYFGSVCGARALRQGGVEIKPAKLERTAELVQSTKEEVARAVKGVERIEGLIAAGHTRYVIGGKEIGAELSVLLNSENANLARVKRALAKLEIIEGAAK